MSSSDSGPRLVEPFSACAATVNADTALIPKPNWDASEGSMAKSGHLRNPPRSSPRPPNVRSESQRKAEDGGNVASCTVSTYFPHPEFGEEVTSPSDENEGSESPHGILSRPRSPMSPHSFYLQFIRKYEVIQKELSRQSVSALDLIHRTTQVLATSSGSSSLVSFCSETDLSKKEQIGEKEKPEGLLDPVEPGAYVAELHTYYRTQLATHSVRVGDDGSLERLYRSEGWHRLTTYLNTSAAVGSTPVIPSCCPDYITTSAWVLPLGFSTATTTMSGKASKWISSQNCFSTDEHPDARSKRDASSTSLTTAPPTSSILVKKGSFQRRDMLGASPGQSPSETMLIRPAVSFSKRTNFYHFTSRLDWVNDCEKEEEKGQST